MLIYSKLHSSGQTAAMWGFGKLSILYHLVCVCVCVCVCKRDAVREACGSSLPFCFSDITRAELSEIYQLASSSRFSCGESLLVTQMQMDKPLLIQQRMSWLDGIIHFLFLFVKFPLCWQQYCQFSTGLEQ